jgi:hypothetical protein
MVPGSLWETANASAVHPTIASRSATQELRISAGTGAVGAVISTIGAVGAVQFRPEADKYRAEASRLRDELAQIDNDLTARLPNP